MVLKLLTSFILLYIIGGAASIDESQNVSMASILDEILGVKYDMRLPPRYDRAPAERQVEVVVNVFVNSIFAITETDMDFSMSIFLRERWIDERLQYEDTLNFTRLELDSSMFDQVWMPDMYILNEKRSDFHEVTVPNKLIHIYPDGTVQYSARVTGVFSCLMFLQKYPFDTQTCHLELESYGHSTENLRFVWSDGAVTLAKGIQFPQFSLVKTVYYSCEKDYYGIIYPCIGMKFILERNYAYYILQIYLPSILIVILSWVNFWLDCTSVPARISLGLLTVLTMTTQSAGARSNLPRVSYVKAIDVYMATCLAFVFLGLLEFAYVNVLTRVEGRQTKNEAKPTASNNNEKKQKDKESPDLANPQDISLSIRSSQSRVPCFKRLSGVGRARLVDKISRVVFPLTFAVFNIVYWIFYFVWHPSFEESM